MEEHTHPADVNLLLDENISPHIVPQLWDARIDAVPLRDRGRLTIADPRVLEYAEKEKRAVATINEFDFRKLVSKKKTHPGVVVIPSGGSRSEQRDYLIAAAEFMRTLEKAHPMLACRDKIIAVNEEYKVSASALCAEPAIIKLVEATNKGA